MNANGPPMPWFILPILTLFVLTAAAALLAWLRQRTAVLVTVIVLMIVVGVGLTTFRVQQEQSVRQQTVDRLRAIGNQLHSDHEQRVKDEYRRLEAEHQATISGTVTINGEKVKEGSIEFEPEATAPAASAPIEEGRFAANTERGAEITTEKKDNAEKPASKLPDWVKQRRVREGDTEWLVVSSSQHADFEAAAAEAQARATQAMTAEFQRAHPECFRWIPPVQLTDSAFRKSHVEELKHDFGRFSGTMYRVYWQIELSPALYSQMYTEWSHQMRLERLWAMCGVVGVVTLLLALSAGYFSLFGSSPRLRLSTHSA